MATEHLDMWESLIGTRKSPLRQAGIIGLGTLWRVFTRSITLEDLVEKVCQRLNIKGRAIVWPHAEPCMDVDKPHQLELLREDLAKQQRKSMARKKAAAKSAKPKTAKPAKTKAAAAKKVKATKTSKTRTSQPKSTVKAKTGKT
jgi:hypothetical protein